MTITDVHVYRDGGTKLIETDHGRYWISQDFRVFKGDNYFKDNGSVEVTDITEIVTLLNCMSYPAERYCYIKRSLK
jgi:hypothetical protein